MRRAHRPSGVIATTNFVPSILETISRGADTSDKISLCGKSIHVFLLLLNPAPHVATSSVSLWQRKLFSLHFGHQGSLVRLYKIQELHNMLIQGTVCYFLLSKGRQWSTTHPCFKLEAENMKCCSPDRFVLYQSQLK